MRIGFDAKRAFFNRSGLGNYSRDIIKSLCRDFPENQYSLYTPDKINGTNFLNAENETAMQNGGLNICTPPSGYGKLRQGYWRSVLLSERLRKDGIELYHGLSNELPKNIHKTGIKSIVTIHDLIFMRYPEWYPLIDAAIYFRKFRKSSRMADRIIAVSQQTKADLMEFFNIEENKIQVIYQGCNELFRQTISETEKNQIRKKYNLPSEYFLYVGTIEERKNLLTIIKALQNGQVDVPLVVVGRPAKYMKKVEKYIKEHAIRNIIFLKELPVNDLPSIYQAASLFLYPSVFEGFGIPILEALYSGIPVITSKGGCFRETGGESSLYVDPSNPDELLEAIQKVISDSALQEKMKTDGLAHAQKFNNANISGQIMNLYIKTVHAQ